MEQVGTTLFWLLGRGPLPLRSVRRGGAGLDRASRYAKDFWVLVEMGKWTVVALVCLEIAIEGESPEKREFEKFRVMVYLKDRACVYVAEHADKAGTFAG